MWASLLGIFVSLLSKLIGEKFIAEALIVLARLWADNTSNKYDDKVVDGLADAWGVKREDVKKLVL